MLGRGCCLGHQYSPVQWPRFHAGQRVGTLPAGCVGSSGVLPAGGSGIISRWGPRPLLLWGVPFAASESQRPDDLLRRVQRRRPGACFAWGCRFRHCCVAVPKSRGCRADFRWLVHVSWTLWGVDAGARTPAPQAGFCVLVWALGTPPVARVAWVALLRMASEVRRSPSPGCPSLRGCWGPQPACCGRGCARVGAQHCPLGLRALWGAACCLGCGGPSGGAGLPLLRGASGVRHRPSFCFPSFRRWAVRVPRPVCPECGRCGRGDPAPAPQHVPLSAIVARCGGRDRGSPGGVLSAAARGV